MIDFIKLNKRLTREEVEQLKNKVDFYGSFIDATGEIISMSPNGKRVLPHLLAWHTNMKIKLYPNGWIEVSGSLHKLFNDGKHNFNQFTKSDLIETVNSLCPVLGISPWEFKVSSIEFGVNIKPPLDSKYIINNSLMYKGRVFETKFHSDEGHYKEVKLTEYSVKIYDKRLHYVSQGYDISDEVLRFELKYNKMRRVNSFGIYTLEDLKENMVRLIDPLLNAWDHVLLFDPAIKHEEIRLKYSNIYFWLSLMEKSRRSYSYKLKKLRKYTEASSIDTQAQVKDVMSNTLNNLL
jgi:hypothetical protein